MYAALCSEQCWAYQKECNTMLTLGEMCQEGWKHTFTGPMPIFPVWS